MAATDPSSARAGTRNDNAPVHPVQAATRRGLALPVILGMIALLVFFAWFAASQTGFGARDTTAPMTNSGGTTGTGNIGDTRGAGASQSGNTGGTGNAPSANSMGGGSADATGSGGASGASGATGGGGAVTNSNTGATGGSAGGASGAVSGGSTGSTTGGSSR